MKRVVTRLYISACCSVRANKPACSKSEKADSTLGHWRCGKCKRPCKVGVSFGGGNANN